jgi:putative hemolysin
MEEMVVVFVCLVFNALFACFEMAFVTVTRSQLRSLIKKGNRSASQILRLRQNPERTLSVIQVGITLVGIISAAVGGAGAEEALSPQFRTSFGLSENLAEALAILCVVVPLTVLNVVIGELVPKTIALRSPARIATLGARGIAVFDRLFSPIVWVLERLTKIVLMCLPKASADLPAEPTTAVEIEHLSHQTQQYVLNLVNVENRKAKDAMVPWIQVASVTVDDRPADVSEKVMNSGHTRLPVLDEGKPNGLLHSKEFIAFTISGAGDWKKLIRPALKISENEPALAALRRMQEKRTHMSIVIDATGRPVGVLTMEDIIEEIVGEIFDEDDDGRIRRLLGTESRTHLFSRFREQILDKTRDFRGGKG